MDIVLSITSPQVAPSELTYNGPPTGISKIGVPVQAYTLESTCLILGFVCFVDNERERNALNYYSDRK